MARILVVDDEETIRKLLTNAITRKGHESIAVEDGFRACDVYDTFKPDVIVSDIKMPKLTGFQMLEELQKRHGAGNLPPVIYITGHGDKTAAIETLRLGAYDYLEKPFDMDELFHRVEAAAKKRKLEQDLSEAQKKLAEKFEAKTELVRRLQSPKAKSTELPYSIELLGNSPAMQPIRDSITRLAKSPIGTDYTVLITGPSGAGKEVAARLVHELSPRANGPWVALNCGALPENLIESELFGHEKGAFTGATARKPGVFEMADGGTLFLDEIGELPLHLQPRLLRAIQEKTFRRVGGTAEIKVDVRIVTATNRNLQKWVSEGKFREDLFYRLNTVTMQVPALSERKEDIVGIAQFLLSQATKGVDGTVQNFSDDAKKVLLAYKWPGNIRELKSAIQRAALLGTGETVTGDVMARVLGQHEVIPLRMVSETGATTTVSTPAPVTSNGGTPLPYHSWKKSFMKEMERNYLLEQLGHFHGNVSALSRFMKVSRPNLCRLLKKHAIVAETFRKGEAGEQTDDVAA